MEMNTARFLLGVVVSYVLSIVDSASVRSSTSMSSCKGALGVGQRGLLSRSRRASSDVIPGLWPGSTVPFVLDESLSQGGRSLRHHLLRAMMLWSRETEIFFIPRTDQVDYVRITWGERCCSDNGRRAGEHLFVIANECANQASLLHHLGLIMGLSHPNTEHTPEQQRNNLLPDNGRDVMSWARARNSAGIRTDINALLRSASDLKDSIMASKYHTMDAKQRLAIKGVKHQVGNSDILRARLLYADQPSCGAFDRARDLQSSAPTQYLHHWGFPGNYEAHADCTWYIQARAGHRVVLSSSALFDLESDSSCRYDYLEVVDIATGNSSRFCGKSINLPVTSSSRFGLAVRFHSDSQVQGRGFHLRYYSQLDRCLIRNGGCQHTCNSDGPALCSCRPGYTLKKDGKTCKPDCSTVLTNPSGEITSPGFPGNYSANLDCLWLIKAPPQHTIVLTIHSFETENHENCTADYLDLRFGPSSHSLLFGRLCGKMTANEPTEVPTDSSNLRLHFHSDSQRQFPGFKLTYRTQSTLVERK